ncbi:hypothetical protein JH146_1508 [Methanocaldococcus bathoardescens]|uniref:Uncharacterized protein n=1 Tax=Methanocaldococcus bathoardescens TaxID=1301915 RepID=A0A076LCW1_9EURY|nr:AAA family ATPase [Methanocaldococcus bathoardescens]AIJ06350.1 hypothetical protein JH146_1508 [Methanocaldococcus bathoardescens]
MLKKLIVKNFKSLHDCEIEFGKFNVVIGRNASGKSNLVEVFKLLRKIYVERDPFPFLEWWGYNNIVWQGMEELPITIGLVFDIEGYEVYFETTFTGVGGGFKILREVLEMKGYFKLIKEENTIIVEHNKNWIDKAFSNIYYDAYANCGHPNKEDVLYQKMEMNLKMDNIFSLIILCNKFSKNSYVYGLIDENKNIFTVKIFSPEDIRELQWHILRLIETLMLFKPIHIKELKTPKPAKKEITLNEDGSNLITVLYNIFLKEGRIPEDILNPLSMIFPNTRISFQLTDDGRVLMKVFEEGVELSPPSISDGFYKTLLILTAIYLKPSILIIDEIENSLYPEALELIFDTLKDSESQIIITTHSPIVVDLTEPKDVIFVDKKFGESRFIRIKNPEKLKEKLNELGLSFSEGWLYGNIFDEDEGDEEE